MDYNTDSFFDILCQIRTLSYDWVGLTCHESIGTLNKKEVSLLKSHIRSNIANLVNSLFMVILFSLTGS